MTNQITEVANQLTVEAVEERLMRNFQPIINHFNRRQARSPTGVTWDMLRQDIQNAIRQITITANNMEGSPFKASFLDMIDSALSNIAHSAAHTLVRDVTIDLVDDEIVIMASNLEDDLFVPSGNLVAEATARMLFKEADYVVVAPNAVQLVQDALSLKSTCEKLGTTPDGISESQQITMVVELLKLMDAEAGLVFINETDERSPAEIFNECLKLMEGSGLKSWSAGTF